MNKFIILALIVSLPTFAQTDELTLESKTAPTVMEDGTDLSQVPMEEPVAESADTKELAPTANSSQGIPAQLPDTSPMELTNKSQEDTTVTESPAEESDDLLEATEPAEEPTEVAETPEQVPTPNPIADEAKPEPKPVTIVDQTPPPSVSTPVITSEAPDDDRFIKHRKSHWISTFGFEGLKYRLPFDFEEGIKKKIRDRDQDLYGARVGLGGQLHLGKGFFTTSMVEAHYTGTLFTKNQEAGPQVSGETVGSIKRTSGLFGADISQNLGYIIEFSTKNPFMDEWTYITFEPFIEAGMGVAQSYNKVNYLYDSGRDPGSNTVYEGYKRRIRDNLTNARVGAGFNVTSRSGFFMQARVSVNRYDIFKRKVDTYRMADDSTWSRDPAASDRAVEKDKKIDPITVFTIGGGYKF